PRKLREVIDTTDVRLRRAAVDARVLRRCRHPGTKSKSRRYGHLPTVGHDHETSARGDEPLRHMYGSKTRSGQLEGAGNAAGKPFAREHPAMLWIVEEFYDI